MTMWPTKSFKQFLQESTTDQEYLALRNKIIYAILDIEEKYNLPYYAEEMIKDPRFQDYNPESSEDVLEYAIKTYQEMPTKKLLSIYAETIDDAEDFNEFNPLALSEEWTLVKGNPADIDCVKRPPKEMQEYVIKLRPDLVGKIRNLDPTIKAKYSHEDQLGKVDL